MKVYRNAIRYMLAPASDGGPPVPYSTTVTIEVTTGRHIAKTTMASQRGHTIVTESEFIKAVTDRDQWRLERAQARQPKEASNG